MATQTAPPTLSDRNFQERAACQLRELMHEVRDLLANHDLYWKVQRVIHSNPRLLAARSRFFDLMNNDFAHSTTMRVRRIVDKTKGTVSLLRLLRGLAKHPGLLVGKVTAGELETDIQELEKATKGLKDYVDHYVAHHAQSPTADIPFNREVNRVVETIGRVYRKYYCVVMGADIDLSPVDQAPNPLAIFRFPWIVD